MPSEDPPAPEAVAIVGIALRFPGARTPETFLQNLLQGVCSVVPHEEWPRGSGAAPIPEDGRARGVGLVPDMDLFDAAYFGLTPREAELMDPQQRFFLECAAEALQRAGEDSDDPRRLVGVYAGMGVNTYFLRHVLPRPGLLSGATAFQAVTSNEKDFIATHTSYRLGLTGPSVSIHTACSTSLVAVATAVEALLSRQCDVALAGGSSLKPDPAFGYFLDEGGIASSDGICRAFDARATGTVGGSGTGVVVLKRLDDAVRDGNPIHAVIRGAAINNDGARKPGFTAPSVEGQAAVIAEAHAAAGVSADTITFVEAHGTGTPVGDPIEVAALTKAFRASATRKGYCALGAVKTNIGHLDAAAGVAGLIKAALALEHRVIPPTLHFEKANPALKLEETPFFVNTAPLPWPEGETPRRAGVSSFGIGGTNAHVVLEEAPRPEARSAAPADPRPHLLVLSARTPSALDAAAASLATHLEEHPGLPLADVAFTLQTGRRRLPHRRALLAATREEAIAALRGQASARRAWTQAGDTRDRPVAFLLPGQGAQHVGMARDLYDREASFRADVDRCAALLLPHLGMDLRSVLYPAPGAEAEAAERLKETLYTQPALFVVEYALARLWMRWGVRPRALIGHSLGEYVAACLAGVFPLEDALTLVAARARLMQEMPRGAMLSVAAGEAALRALLPEGIAVAAVNAEGTCVVSGEPGSIEALQALLAAKGVESRPLPVTRAFHSSMLDPILPRFEAVVRGLRLQAPRIPFVSNLTGDWARAEEVTAPEYWVRHLRHTVRFHDGLSTLLADPALCLLEVGPGRTLSSLASRHAGRGREQPVLASMRHMDDSSATDDAVLREALARLWLAGASVEWRAVHAPAKPRLARLPPYPFERRRYWLDPVPFPWEGGGGPSTASPDIHGSVSVPVVVQEAPSEPRHERPAHLTTAYAPAGTPLEETLVEIWEDLFGFKGVGVHDDFFDLGGHSLLATKLVSRLRETFEVEVTLERLFTARTVADLAPVLEAALLERLEALSEDDARQALESR